MRTRCLIVAMALLPLPTLAGFQTGNLLLGEISAESGSDYMFGIGYVSGVFDAYADISHCVTAHGVTQKQALLIAKRYLESNPELLHQPAEVLLQSAFKAAFPLPQSPNQLFQPTSLPPLRCGNAAAERGRYAALAKR